jgi:uncharacterized protein YfaS (alpha-2-macroglobulin family)
MLVRQELVAQPALPRFVRPGDVFAAGLVGRVVEGSAGTGRATLAVEGLALGGADEQRFAWTQNRPARLDFPVTVTEPAIGHASVRLRFGLRRDADGVSDHVQIDLPVQPDQSPRRRYEIAEVTTGGRLDLAPPTESIRPGSFQRSVTLAADPALVRLVAGLTYLAAYPFGCTEQRIALASSTLALKPFAPILAAARLEGRVSADVRSTVQTIQPRRGRSGGLLAARAWQCVADGVGLHVPDCRRARRRSC